MTTSKIDYTDPKYQDPLEEIYAIRREISEQYGHDIHRMFEGLREWQREQEANGVKFNFAPSSHCSPSTCDGMTAISNRETDMKGRSHKTVKRS